VCSNQMEHRVVCHVQIIGYEMMCIRKMMENLFIIYLFILYLCMQVKQKDGNGWKCVSPPCESRTPDPNNENKCTLSGDTSGMVFLSIICYVVCYIFISVFFLSLFFFL
jgi:hypothetical protein